MRSYQECPFPSSIPGLVVVSGHKCNMQRGPLSASGAVTISKRATAWEALMYLEMVLEADEALAHLKLFVPPLVAILPPENVAQDSWVCIEDPGSALLLEKLLQRLRRMRAEAVGYSEAMDAAMWGVRLIDVSAKFRKPAVLDVKLGCVRHSPHTPSEKVERILGRQLGRQQLIRICGAHHHFCSPAVSDTENLVQERFTKDMGYALRSDREHGRVLRSFLSTTSSMMASTTGEVPPAPDARAAVRLRCFLQRIQMLVDFFKSPLGQKLLERTAFVSTSLLLAYDAVGGDAEVRAGNDVGLYLIDFSRSGDRRLHFPESVVGFVRGLEKIASLLAE